MSTAKEDEHSRIRQMSHVSRESKAVLHLSRPSMDGGLELCIETIRRCIPHEKSLGNPSGELQLLEYQVEVMTNAGMDEGAINEVKDEIHNHHIDQKVEADISVQTSGPVPTQRKGEIPFLDMGGSPYGSSGRRQSKSHGKW